MENRKYVVCRDAVCAGKVVKIDKDLGYVSCRSMLFVPTKENMANDLLYQTNSYPILEEKTSDVTNQSLFVVKDVLHLDEILKYFGYHENLTYEDIIKIRKNIFSCYFTLQNYELFGWKKVDSEISINPNCPVFYRNGYHLFVGSENGTFARKIMYQLIRLSDHSLEEYLEDRTNKLSAFTPSKEEGPIKKLKKERFR